MVIVSVLERPEVDRERIRLTVEFGKEWLQLYPDHYGSEIVRHAIMMAPE
jgi:hypothetical protein